MEIARYSRAAGCAIFGDGLHDDQWHDQNQNRKDGGG
jgi:hypothetical protein